MNLAFGHNRHLSAQLADDVDFMRDEHDGDLRAVQPLEQIEKDTDRDNFMSAVDAQSYGLIDTVLEKRP